MSSMEGIGISALMLDTGHLILVKSNNDLKIFFWNSISQLFPTAIAENRTGQVFSLALGAKLGNRFFVRRVSAFGAEFCIRCQILAAVDTLIKN